MRRRRKFERFRFNCRWNGVYLSLFNAISSKSFLIFQNFLSSLRSLQNFDPGIPPLEFCRGGINFLGVGIPPLMWNFFPLCWCISPFLADTCLKTCFKIFKTVVDFTGEWHSEGIYKTHFMGNALAYMCVNAYTKTVNYNLYVLVFN